MQIMQQNDSNKYSFEGMHRSVSKDVAVLLFNTKNRRGGILWKSSMLLEGEALLLDLVEVGVL